MSLTLTFLHFVLARALSCPRRLKISVNIRITLRSLTSRRTLSDSKSLLSYFHLSPLCCVLNSFATGPNYVQLLYLRENFNGRAVGLGFPWSWPFPALSRKTRPPSCLHGFALVLRGPAGAAAVSWVFFSLLFLYFPPSPSLFTMPLCGASSCSPPLS
ncbi:hypothetical protein C8F04DRAFT_1264988 [Mycena alexandri]|uniref:Secreted protein n=1 Tax=Mycena alexandri TaxID=1745969 RepID=A0AAD6SJT7_9AGAR|nr:hypothetical protein C8F04DRAFT_1264988 [Mycena alexandri]